VGPTKREGFDSFLCFGHIDVPRMSSQPFNIAHVVASLALVSRAVGRAIVEGALAVARAIKRCLTLMLTAFKECVLFVWFVYKEVEGRAAAVLSEVVLVVYSGRTLVVLAGLGILLAWLHLWWWLGGYCAAILLATFKHFRLRNDDFEQTVQSHDNARRFLAPLCVWFFRLGLFAASVFIWHFSADFIASPFRRHFPNASLAFSRVSAHIQGTFREGKGTSVAPSPRVGSKAAQPDTFIIAKKDALNESDAGISAIFSIRAGTLSPKFSRTCITEGRIKLSQTEGVVVRGYLRGFRDGWIDSPSDASDGSYFVSPHANEVSFYSETSDFEITLYKHGQGAPQEPNASDSAPGSPLGTAEPHEPAIYHVKPRVDSPTFPVSDFLKGMIKLSKTTGVLIRWHARSVGNDVFVETPFAADGSYTSVDDSRAVSFYSDTETFEVNAY